MKEGSLLLLTSEESCRDLTNRTVLISFLLVEKVIELLVWKPSIASARMHQVVFLIKPSTFSPFTGPPSSSSVSMRSAVIW